MKEISLFAGVGGICSAFRNAGVEIVYANEFDEKASLTYKTNFGDTFLSTKSIVEVDEKQIPDGDILSAGFPCQAFSIAGYRKGFSDERGNLFFDTLRIIAEKKPKVILLENVKNLVSHDNGKTFSIIIEALEQEGYFIRTAVLNSMEFGNVPQNRERIYIVGFLDREKASSFNFPEPIVLTNTLSSIIKKSEKQADKYYYTQGKFYEMLCSFITNPNSVYQIRRQYVRENKKNVFPTLTANMGMGGHNVPIIVDDFGIRKITPREAFLVQGFPETFILPNVSDCHLYKQAGNSVSVPVVERIVKNIIECL